MARRLTDSTKWDSEWFRLLPTKMKCAFFYIYDKCDHAGFWIPDFGLMSYVIGDEITQQDVESHFCDVLERTKNNKYFILGFLPLQYKKLRRNNKVHQSAIHILEENEAYLTKTKTEQFYAPQVIIQSPSPSPLIGAKEREKDKDIDIDMDMDMDMDINMDNILSTEKKKTRQSKARPKEEAPLFDFEIPYQIYPRKEGKARGFSVLKKTVKTDQDFNDFCKAVENYKNETIGKQQDFIFKFNNFVGTPDIQCWRDHIEPKQGIKKHGKVSADDLFERSRNEND